MGKEFRDGYMWDSDISGLNLRRENKYGTVLRREFFPGGPVEETFISNDPDQMDLLASARSQPSLKKEQSAASEDKKAQTTYRAPRRIGGGMKKI